MIDDELHELNERRIAELRRQVQELTAERDLERKRKEHERREAITARAERDAALKLVDDTLLAVGGEPLPEMGQPEYAQPRKPKP